MPWYDSLRDAVRREAINRCTTAGEEIAKEELVLITIFHRTDKFVVQGCQFDVVQ